MKEINIVDTFTTERFKGNPTSVCYSTCMMDEQEMQLMAKELNLPVTAFVFPAGENLQIRYFTTLKQIPACGHASLGAAMVVHDLTSQNSFNFQTKDGLVLSVKIANGTATMFYPRYQLKPFEANKALLQSLGVNQPNTIFICHELQTVFIEVTATELRKLQPDFRKLVLASTEIEEVVVTAASDDKTYDYLLRSFCPWIGIDEDPVTGSVHSALAPYWSEKLSRQNFRAYQASERGGELILSVQKNTVEIKGSCVFVMKGKLL